MLYNGEIFSTRNELLQYKVLKFLDAQLLNEFDSLDCNDGLQLSRILFQASEKAKQEDLVVEFLEELKWLLKEYFIESDMSFVYLDRQNKITLAYRDIYGKRSLILQ